MAARKPALPRARRRFGQHFLTDAGVIARIVELIDPHPGDNLIEIGPGCGALTRPVLTRSGRLCAIEIDRDLAERLRCDPELQQRGAFTVINADALRTDFAALARGGPLRVFGNLPYNISSPLLFYLLTQELHGGHIADLTFMLQKEVALRLCAHPGSRAYGRLTVMARFCAGCTPLLTVGPAAFAPRPQVTSEVVRIVPHAADAQRQALYPFLSRVTVTAFSARRKQAGNALCGLFTADELREAGVRAELRPEQLTPEHYMALAGLLQRREQGETWNLVSGSS